MGKKGVDWLKKNKLLVGVQVGILVLIGGIFFFTRPKEPVSKSKPDFFTEQTSSASREEVKKEEKTAGTSIYVDIKGAVKHPGMYQAQEELRVNDIVEMAGGFLPNAQRKKVNLAMKIVDQMVIYVPEVGEKVEETELASGEKTQEDSEGGATSKENKDQSKININTADAAELQKITGVGPKKAEEIVNYREKNGSFKSIEDLKNVSGIGAKTIDKIKDEITV